MSSQSPSPSSFWETPPARRQFLAWASASAVLAAQGGLASEGSPLAPSPEKDSGPGPRLLHLELLTAAPLAEMVAFYHQTLGLRVVEEQAERVTFAAGDSLLTFLPVKAGGKNPFYHFAFNIPENKILSARAWHLKRGPLMPIPERLRDPNYPPDVVDYSHWNAHSLFFYDPGGNVVEYIARHDLKNSAKGVFSSKDILYASEIAFIVDDVLATASQLKRVAGVESYRGESEQFAALGDERGLLLVMKRGRILNFHATSQEKAADVFRTVVSVGSVKATQYRFPTFPYTLSVSKEG